MICAPVCLETPLGSCEISFLRTVIFAGISNCSVTGSEIGADIVFGSAKTGSFSSSISSKKFFDLAGFAGSAKKSSSAGAGVEEAKISSDAEGQSAGA